MQYVWMILVTLTAFAKGRSIILWLIAGYLFGWLAAIPLIFLKTKEKKVSENLDKIEKHLDNVLIKQEPGKYNTVDDLFKQLDKK